MVWGPGIEHRVGAASIGLPAWEKMPTPSPRDWSVPEVTATQAEDDSMLIRAWARARPLQLTRASPVSGPPPWLGGVRSGYRGGEGSALQRLTMSPFPPPRLLTTSVAAHPWCHGERQHRHLLEGLPPAREAGEPRPRPSTPVGQRASWMGKRRSQCHPPRPPFFPPLQGTARGFHRTPPSAPFPPTPGAKRPSSR